MLSFAVDSLAVCEGDSLKFGMVELVYRILTEDIQFCEVLYDVSYSVV